MGAEIMPKRTYIECKEKTRLRKLNLVKNERLND